MLTTFQQRTETQKQFNDEYKWQHQRMINVIKESNELSILLYTQEQEMTFDLAYALKKVTAEYNDFSNDRRPYDRIVGKLNYEIDRYARLIEALRRLPPMIQEIEEDILPDSLSYRNDSLDLHLLSTDSSLEKEVISIAVNNSKRDTPFVLDKEGQLYRDSCIHIISELLKMNADNRAKVIADSTHYEEASLRIKETRDYAEKRYRDLERYVFIDGQTPFLDILADFDQYWSKTKADLRAQYGFKELAVELDNAPNDDIHAGEESESFAFPDEETVWDAGCGTEVDRGGMTARATTDVQTRVAQTPTVIAEEMRFDVCLPCESEGSSDEAAA